MPFALKTILSALIIATSSWLANKNPRLAGWIIAMPISSMIAIFFTQAEFRETSKSVLFAKNIFLSVPLSLLFFVPFLFAEKLRLGFGAAYLSGVLLLSAGYIVHRWFLA